MAGNSFGKIFRITTFGESHGKAIGVIIDGCPAGLEINESYIQKELDRRKPGQSRVTTQRKEEDRAEILSGVFEGKATGAPITLVIYNKDADSGKYVAIKELFRPGHADFTYFKKYGVRDWRGGGRASSRETAARVAAGAIAKRILEKEGIKIIGYTKEVAGIAAGKIDYGQIEKNMVRCPDAKAAKRMETAILNALKEGNSVGGIVEITAKRVPPGLGEPVFDKLSADIAKALMSIGAVKGVEIGDGFALAGMKGSESNDQMGKKGFLTNHCGGILGGISTGQDITVRIAVKPTSSIAKEQKTIDIKGRESRINVFGRHDPCICPRIVPVAESMMALVLADHLLRQRLTRA